MKTSVLIAINDSVISRQVIDKFTKLSMNFENLQLTLVHVFRQPTASEKLIQQEIMTERQKRFREYLEETRSQLIRNGFLPEQILIRLIEHPYPTVADGLIDQFNHGSYDLVVIGRKRMSKAEEFVMGDPGIKLVRALENTAILIVK